MQKFKVLRKRIEDWSNKDQLLISTREFQTYILNFLKKNSLKFEDKLGT